MGGHIVDSLQGVLILTAVLRNKPVENGFHIQTHIRVSIFVDSESATGMLAENMDDASLWQLGQLAHYLASHQMKASRLWTKSYLYLLNHLSVGLNPGFVSSSDKFAQ